jgi:hypothetical protein
MAKQNNNDKKIQDYLSGDLSGSQRQEFEEELNKDADLQADFHLYQQVEEELGNKPALEFRKKLEAINLEDHNQSNYNSRRWFIPISIVLIIAALFIWWNKRVANPTQSAQQIIAQIQPAEVLGPDISTNIRGDETFEDREIKQWETAIQSINDAAYEKAQSLLLQIPTDQQSAIGETYYFALGLVHLKTGAYKDAIPAFQQIADEAYPNRHWYLALAHLQLEEQDKAIFHLQEVLNLPNSKELKTEAQSLLNALH